MYTTKIKSIKKIGEIETYDLHTPKYHNFFLDNGIVSHNSGKSYTSLKIGELWYNFHFDKPFPIKNCCFTIDQMITLLHSKELKRGELIILEEAGINLNSLDFQNKISKLFTFVLQSFRSMNLCLIMNLPVLTMLNKSARLLLHANFVTSSINFEKKTVLVKPYFHQLNQQTGKVYSKWLRVRFGDRVRPVERFNYKIPSNELVNQYEKEKIKFVSDLLGGFVEKLKEEQTIASIKMARNELTDIEQEAYEDEIEGLTIQQSADKHGKSYSTQQETRQRYHRKGYGVKKEKFSKEKRICPP